ncbi:MAG: hypothetical protein ACR65R_05370 [Methylomicrobium sp.]
MIFDTNAFGPFFDKKNTIHGEFRPALEWVLYGKGKLVFGGDKYKKELKAAPKYIRFFAALEKAGKIVKVNDEKVNDLEDLVRNIEPSNDFDDPHIIAIVLVSNCHIVCTGDLRAIPYIKDSRFYTNGTKKPKLYISSRNASLLSDKYISSICKPCQKLAKKSADSLIKM